MALEAGKTSRFRTIVSVTTKTHKQNSSRVCFLVHPGLDPHSVRSVWLPLLVCFLLITLQSRVRTSGVSQNTFNVWDVDVELRQFLTRALHALVHWLQNLFGIFLHPSEDKDNTKDKHTIRIWKEKPGGWWRIILALTLLWGSSVWFPPDDGWAALLFWS